MRFGLKNQESKMNVKIVKEILKAINQCKCDNSLSCKKLVLLSVC